MPSLPAWLTVRLPLLLGAVVCALGPRCAEAPPPARELPDFSRSLGAAGNVVVEPSSVRWEPSRGVLGDLFLGRRLLFLAHEVEGAPADVFRGRVAVTAEGQPLRVLALQNLSDTPDGAEAGLRVQGRHAAYVAFSEGLAQGVTVLDLAGARKEDLPGNLANRLLLRVRAVQETDSVRGLSATHLHLPPTPKLALHWVGAELVLGRPEEDPLTYDARERRWLGDARGALIVPHPFGSSYWLHTLADLLREELGPEVVFRLASLLFGVQDGTPEPPLLPTPEATTEGSPEPTEPPSVWPPNAIPPRVGVPLPGEGHWQSPRLEGASPAWDEGLFYTTSLRPDPERPHVSMHLVAMDMRRLELGMEGGYEDPRPKTGLPGRGAVPDKPEIVGRLRATFNGAFKSLHGEYGMVVDRRVLVPPVPGAASVVLTENGDLGFGLWPPRQRAAEVLSLRQNLDPLIANSELNPTQRSEWGEHHLVTGTLTERSAICLSRDGHLYYAWGEQLSADTLAAGLLQAGCTFAMHLDMNPNHCGFFFHEAREPKLERVRGWPAFPGLEIASTRFAKWSSKDFFYVLVRDGRSHGGRWLPSVGEQPELQTIPAITTLRDTVGSVPVDVTRIAAGRVGYALIAGGGEPLLPGRPAPRRSLDDPRKPLFAINLGHTTQTTRYGLAFRDEATLPLRADLATLLLTGSRLELVPSGQVPELKPGQGAVQLPELMTQGEPSPRSRERGSLRERSALCLEADGSVLVASGRHDTSDVLAIVLGRLGCTQIVELDRGSQHAGFLHRAGTPDGPRESYETTVLVGLPEPMSPRTFSW